MNRDSPLNYEYNENTVGQRRVLVSFALECASTPTKRRPTQSLLRGRDSKGVLKPVAPGARSPVVSGPSIKVTEGFDWRENRKVLLRQNQDHMCSHRVH